MLALAYIPASVAGILNNGLELVFSVVAARVVRKRTILPQRWLGVGVVVLGLSWVGISDFVGSRKGGFADSSPRSVLVGLACVFGQVFSGVLRVISEELLIHETNFPASLLLGLEGCIELVIGIPIYFAVAALVGQELGEDFREVLPAIGENTGYIIYTLFLVLVFFVASLFQILSTGVTSSMTRNVWKNFRGLLVWIIGIIAYYSSDGGFGEPFNIPGSLMLLGGFSLMMLGLFIYYRKETFKCNCNRPFRRCEEEHSIEYSC
jgi:drug/metabolite transporter (DMT)-like permease